MPKKKIVNSPEFPEVRGKVVDKVVFTDDGHGEPNIEIMFADKTSLYFELRPRVTLEPELWDWRTGNSRVMKCYPAVTT
jgi:hypothetical protein